MLVEQDLPPALGSELHPLIAEALAQRPDLLARERARDASYQAAQAEKRLAYPTVGIAAKPPAEFQTAITRCLTTTTKLRVINLSIPVFNGGLLLLPGARKPLAAQTPPTRTCRLIRSQVTREVQTAWYEANTAFRRLDVTAQLVDETAESVRLAQARYDAGLGSIIELNQAQLNQIQAQIDAASAKYDYLNRRTTLNYCHRDVPLSRPPRNCAMKGEPNMGKFDGKPTRSKTILIFVLAVGFTSCSRSHGEPAEVHAAVSTPPVVSVAKVSPQHYLDQPGFDSGIHISVPEIDVMAKEAGYIKSIGVDIGDRVQAGQKLAELEIPEMQDSIVRAGAGVEAADADVTTARNDLDRAKAVYDIAHLSYTRILRSRSGVARAGAAAGGRRSSPRELGSRGATVRRANPLWTRLSARWR